MNDRAVMQACLWASALPILFVTGQPVAAQSGPVLPSQVDISRERVPQDLPPQPDYQLRIQTPEKSAVPRSVELTARTLPGIFPSWATKSTRRSRRTSTGHTITVQISETCRRNPIHSHMMTFIVTARTAPLQRYR